MEGLGNEWGWGAWWKIPKESIKNVKEGKKSWQRKSPQEAVSEAGHCSCWLHGSAVLAPAAFAGAVFADVPDTMAIFYAEKERWHLYFYEYKTRFFISFSFPLACWQWPYHFHIAGSVTGKADNKTAMFDISQESFRPRDSGYHVGGLVLIAILTGPGFSQRPSSGLWGAVLIRLTEMGRWAWKMTALFPGLGS